MLGEKNLSDIVKWSKKKYDQVESVSLEIDRIWLGGEVISLCRQL